jgi:hypothetical protein
MALVLDADPSATVRPSRTTYQIRPRPSGLSDRGTSYNVRQRAWMWLRSRLQSTRLDRRAEGIGRHLSGGRECEEGHRRRIRCPFRSPPSPPAGRSVKDRPGPVPASIIGEGMVAVLDLWRQGLVFWRQSGLWGRCDVPDAALKVPRVRKHAAGLRWTTDAGRAGQLARYLAWA